MGFDDLADQASLAAKGVGSHGGKHRVCLFRGYDGDQFSLIGNIEGIKSEEFTGRPNTFMDGNVCLIDLKSKTAAPGPIQSTKFQDLPV